MRSYYTVLLFTKNRHTVIKPTIEKKKKNTQISQRTPRDMAVFGIKEFTEVNNLFNEGITSM